MQFKIKLSQIIVFQLLVQFCRMLELLCVGSMHTDSLSQRPSSLLMSLQKLGRLLLLGKLVVAVQWARLGWLAHVLVEIPESERPQVQLALHARLRGI